MSVCFYGHATACQSHPNQILVQTLTRTKNTKMRKHQRNVAVDDAWPQITVLWNPKTRLD